MQRKSYVSGFFYPGEESELRNQLESFMNGDKEKEPIEVFGALVPHAGYVYSGDVAGYVFSHIIDYDTYIILCPNHTGLGGDFSIMLEGVWKTPLGNMGIDNEIAEKIVKQVSFVQDDASAHKGEHSIEVQLPFLQYKSMDSKIVPICLASFDVDRLKELGKVIADIIKISDKKICIITSSDMTHYETQDIVKNKDKMAIDAMLSMDENELIKVVSENNISMCGFLPAIVMIEAVKLLGAKKAELLNYHTSGDVAGDINQVVGYAGMVFY